jgi:hypothetical protein
VIITLPITLYRSAGLHPVYPNPTSNEDDPTIIENDAHCLVDCKAELIPYTTRVEQKAQLFRIVNAMLQKVDKKQSVCIIDQRWVNEAKAYIEARNAALP